MMRLRWFAHVPDVFGVVRRLRRALRTFQQRRARRRVLALIRRSGLFDAAWYLGESPDVAKAGIDPAKHYLIHGWLEGRNPSPLFDGQEYLARHPECVAAGVNPLVHHLQLEWVKEKVVPPSRPHEAADPPVLLAAEVAVPDRPRSWRRGSTEGAAAGRNAYRIGDCVLGYGPAEAAGIHDLRRDVRCLLRLGRHERCDLVAVVDGHRHDRDQDGDISATASPAAADIFHFSAAGAPRFDDAWFATSHCLRVRLSAAGDGAQTGIVTALQWPPGDPAPVLSEAALGATGMDFVDVRLANPFLPLLIVLTTPAGDLRASTLVPFPSLCRGGLHHAEALVSPAGAAALDGVRLASARLLAGWAAAGGAASLDWVEVDLSRATGAERLFATDLWKWLRDVLEVGIRPFEDGLPADHPGAVWLRETVRQAARQSCEAQLRAAAGEARTARILRLASDAVPTLHALFGLVRADEGHAAFILCRGGDGVAAWVVTPPRKDMSLEQCQPGPCAPFPRLLGPARDASASAGFSGPAALGFTRSMRRQAAELQAPFPPETPADRIVPGAFARSPHPARATALLVHGSDRERCAARLEALALQTGVSWERVLLVADAADQPAATLALHDFFPHCGTVVAHGPETPLHARFNEAAALARGELLLVLGGDVLLHDRRAVACLAALVAPLHVASAACMLIGGGTGTKFEQLDVIGCGCHVSAPVKDHSNFSHLRLPDFLAALPPATWPVAANTTTLFLVRRRDWDARGGFEPGSSDAEPLSTRFWEAAVGAGHQHLVTTAVSARWIEPKLLPEPAVRSEPTASEFAMAARRIVA